MRMGDWSSDVCSSDLSGLKAVFLSERVFFHFVRSSRFLNPMFLIGYICYYTRRRKACQVFFANFRKKAFLPKNRPRFCAVFPLRKCTAVWYNRSIIPGQPETCPDRRKQMKKHRFPKPFPVMLSAVLCLAGVPFGGISAQAADSVQQVNNIVLFAQFA